MEKKAKKQRPFPFWLQIVSILLCGVLVSGGVYFVMRNGSETEKNRETKKYMVTFAYQDGTVIDTRQVEEGKGVFPPEFKTDHVFQGWSTALNAVRADVEAHPLVYEIADENLFYFNSVYVKEGSEFTIELMLAGTVCISSAEITISYDAEVTEYIKSADADCCTVTEGEKGSLLLRLNSETPLTEKCLLSQITFQAKEKDVYSTQINLSCTNPMLGEAGLETPATASTINNRIYYLQEVG